MLKDTSLTKVLTHPVCDKIFKKEIQNRYLCSKILRKGQFNQKIYTLDKAFPDDSNNISYVWFPQSRLRIKLRQSLHDRKITSFEIRDQAVTSHFLIITTSNTREKWIYLEYSYPDHSKYVSYVWFLISFVRKNWLQSQHLHDAREWWI